MDERAFGRFARTLGAVQTRRRLAGMGGLASLGLSAGLGVPGESAAKKKSCKKACIGRCGAVMVGPEPVWRPSPSRRT